MSGAWEAVQDIQFGFILSPFRSIWDPLELLGSWKTTCLGGYLVWEADFSIQKESEIVSVREIAGFWEALDI